MALPRGRIYPKREIVSIRPITREDLPRLMKPRDASGAQPQKIRESHHQVARLLAGGMRYKQIAALTGYAYTRVAVLATSPAMIELVAQYRADINEAINANIDAYANLAIGNMIGAERQIADHLAEADEAGELLPLRELRAISSDRADRFGYGKRQTNINVNADFAAMLEKAIARSGKTIEGTVQSSTPQGATAPEPLLRPAGSVPSPEALPAPIRRRA